MIPCSIFDIRFFKKSKGGIASGFAFGYDPTRRTVVLKWIEYLKSKIRIPKSKICFLKFLFSI